VLLSAVQKLSSSRNRDILIDSAHGFDAFSTALTYLLARAGSCERLHRSCTPYALLLIDQELLTCAVDVVSACCASREAPSQPAIIGSSSDPKQDLPLLQGCAPVLISTPRRLIDHMRRKNIMLEQVRQTCMIFRPEHFTETSIESFENDLLFITAKLSRSSKKLLFTQRDRLSASAVELLKNPKVITDRELTAPAQATWHVLQKITPDLITQYIIDHHLERAYILCEDPALYHQFTDYLSTHTETNPPATIVLSEAGSLSEKAGHIIYAGLPDHLENSSLPGCVNPAAAEVHHFFVTAENHHAFPTIEENFTMNRQFTASNDQETVSEKIRMLIREIEKDAHPGELNELKRAIKKEVPFYRRGYFSAYLLRTFLSTSKGRSSAPRPAAVPTIAEEDTATLFFGIGKNRRTYPKDIARLLKAEAGLENEDISTIKTLENYSFVSVHKEKAAQAIEKLNGLSYKGRALVVNYARSKTK